MQFTVLIEFLIPGLVTVLLGLVLCPEAATLVHKSLPPGDATTALLLLAISYPVGHLVNFPVFLVLQQALLMPIARRLTFRAYKAMGLDLADRATQQLGIDGVKFGKSSRKEIRELFNYMETVVFCRNIERLNANDLFYKSLQRLARGMLFPLLLAIYLVWNQKICAQLPAVLVVLSVFFGVCLLLLIYFLRVQENEIARFFIVLTATPKAPASGPPTPPVSAANPS
jgi:hypothetical protein